MKKFKTTNGNYLLNVDGTELVYLTASKVFKHNVGTFDTKQALEQGLEELPVFTDELNKAWKFISQKYNNIDKSLELIRDELVKYKIYFGNLPKWIDEGFKSEKAYLKHLEKKLLKSLRDTFGFKTLKDTRANVIRVYTTKYHGKNGGYKHFSREIITEFDVKDNIHRYNRKRNIIICDYDDNIIESRGNITIDEINVKMN